MEYEYTLTLPGGITIGISAVGGGTVGKAYANNHWQYEVRENSELICEGADLRSGWAPATHEVMAGTLLSFLDNEADVYTGSGEMGTAEPADGWGWDVKVAEWCYLNSDALGMARVEIEESDND